MKRDMDYEIKINALIPTAEKEARERVDLIGVKSVSKGGYNHCLFTEYFHKAMKRLAIENGLRTF